MKLKILSLLIVLLSSISFTQWERVGFENTYINNIAIKENQLLIPVSISNIDKTIIYGSADYGESWDSLGYINTEWIDDIEVMGQYIFCSWNWGCYEYCPSLPCIFRICENGKSYDTLYEQKYGVTNLLAHHDILTVKKDSSFMRSINFGESWEQIITPSGNAKYLCSIDTLLFLFYFDKKQIFVSNNGGLAWQLYIDDLPGLSSCVINNKSNLYFGGEYGVVRFVNSVGWELCNNGLPENFSVFHMVTGNNALFAAGTALNRLVYCSTNGGDNWFDISSGLNLNPYEWINYMLVQGNYLFLAATGVWRYDFSSLVKADDLELEEMDFSLSQNFPNPFNPSTKIKYTIPNTNRPLLGGARGGLVTLKIFDVLGMEVAILVDECKPAGSYEVEFNLSSIKHNPSSGVYFYRLQAGDPSANSGQSFVQTRKMILLK